MSTPIEIPELTPEQRREISRQVQAERLSGARAKGTGAPRRPSFAKALASCASETLARMDGAKRTASVFILNSENASALGAALVAAGVVKSAKTYANADGQIVIELPAGRGA